MTYKIRPESVVVAVRHSGQTELQVVTKEKTYPEATRNGDYFVFQVKPGGAWREFHALRKDVEVQIDIDGIPDGTYTVVFSTDTDYVTIRLETGRHEVNEDGSINFFFGKQVVSFLSGPDNENNFTGFAHLDEHGGIHVWKRFKESNGIARYVNALALLQKQGAGYQEEAGMAYALRSGRCRKCTRVLTVPASLHRGLGPICARGGIDK